MTRSKIGLNNLLKTNKQYERELEIGKIAYQKRALAEKEAKQDILSFRKGCNNTMCFCTGECKKNADREI